MFKIHYKTRGPDTFDQFDLQLGGMFERGPYIWAENMGKGAKTFNFSEIKEIEYFGEDIMEKAIIIFLNELIEEWDADDVYSNS